MGKVLLLLDRPSYVLYLYNHCNFQSGRPGSTDNVLRRVGMGPLTESATAVLGMMRTALDRPWGILGVTMDLALVGV